MWQKTLKKSYDLSRDEEKIIAAYEQDPDGVGFLPMAQLLYRLDHKDEAIEILLAGLATHPRHHVARVVVVQYLWEKGLFVMAHRLLSETPREALEGNALALELSFKLALVLEDERGARTSLASLGAFSSEAKLSNSARDPTTRVSELIRTYTLEGPAKARESLLADYDPQTIQLSVPGELEALREDSSSVDGSALAGGHDAQQAGGIAVSQLRGPSDHRDATAGPDSFLVEHSGAGTSPVISGGYRSAGACAKPKGLAELSHSPTGSLGTAGISPSRLAGMDPGMVAGGRRSVQGASAGVTIRIAPGAGGGVRRGTEGSEHPAQASINGLLSESLDPRFDDFHTVALGEIFTSPSSEVPVAGATSGELDSMTLAEIFEKQHCFAKALAIYRRLSSLSPGHDGLRKKILMLEKKLKDEESSQLEDVEEVIDTLRGRRLIDGQRAFLQKMLESLSLPSSQNSSQVSSGESAQL